MIIQVDSKELDEFFAKVGKATVRKTLQGSLRKSLFLLENEAKKETPVDTGFLRNSYETNQTDLE